MGPEAHVGANRLPEGCCYHNGVTDYVDRAARDGLHAIFLDRDGVLNEKMPEGRWVTSWNEFRMLPRVPEAIARLNQVGLRVIVVSNQRGIALGRFSAADVLAIQARFESLLEEHGAHVDGFYYCPHDRLECNCRKPLPGMFLQAQSEFPEITAGTSAMVGDSLADIEFGKRLGMFTVFIEGDMETQKSGAEAAGKLADLRLRSLAEAVEELLSRK
jgi:D-glycero-D-manno-heptose 1,7-bisphosphate phosphatase